MCLLNLLVSNVKLNRVTLYGRIYRTSQPSVCRTSTQARKGNNNYNEFPSSYNFFCLQNQRDLSEETSPPPVPLQDLIVLVPPPIPPQPPQLFEEEESKVRDEIPMQENNSQPLSAELCSVISDQTDQQGITLAHMHCAHARCSTQVATKEEKNPSLNVKQNITTNQEHVRSK